MAEADETASVSATARELNNQLGFVYGLIWSGKLVATKDGLGRWRVSRKSIEERQKHLAEYRQKRGGRVEDLVEG